MDFFAADISTGVIASDNVNSVSSTRFKESSGSREAFNSPKFDRTLSGSMGYPHQDRLAKSPRYLLIYPKLHLNNIYESDDDYQSYGLTLGLDTVFLGQSVSPYYILNKSDYQHDADSFSKMYGLGGFFSVGERNSFSYGFSYSNSKGNNNESDTTANETNSSGHSITLGHDFIVNQLITTNISLVTVIPIQGLMQEMIMKITI